MAVNTLSAERIVLGTFEENNISAEEARYVSKRRQEERNTSYTACSHWHKASQLHNLCELTKYETPGD